MSIFKKKEVVVEDDRVDDLFLKTEEQLKEDNELDKPLPKLVSEEEAYFKVVSKKKESTTPYKARKE